MSESEWVEKFPWIKDFIFQYGGDIIFSECPSGWTPMLYELLSDVKNIVDSKHINFNIIQIKEKYGELRFYYSPHIKEIDNIINKYEIISKNICFNCSKPDSPTLDLNGYLCCYCKDCFNKIKQNIKSGCVIEDFMYN